MALELRAGCLVRRALPSVSGLVQSSGSQLSAARQSRGKPGVARCAADASVAKPRQSWLPGSELPAYLDGSLPGDVGFDPLGLAEDPEALRWYVQSELVHSRFAMMGVAGMLGTDILRVTGLAPGIPVWFDAGAAEYSLDNPTLLAIEFILFNFVELKRYADFKSPGSQGDYEKAFFFFIEPALAGTGNGYPGGPLFDPLGMASGFGTPHVHELKEKELANGRLAMVAAVGFFVQAKLTGKGPFENLLEHLSNPWHSTVVDNFLP